MSETIGRSILPILDRPHVGLTTYDATDPATPVSDDYGPKDSRFNGRIRWVQIDLGDDAADADHLISPEERYRVAMARQVTGCRAPA